MSEPFALGEIDRVLGDDRLRAPGRGLIHDEFDVFAQLPARSTRRLAGAGFLTAGGLAHDVAADLIIERVAEVHWFGEAIQWYVRTALEACREVRVAAHARQFQARDRRARRDGFGSYYYQRLYRRELGAHAQD